MNLAAVGDPETCSWLKLAGVGEIFPIEDELESKALSILTNLWQREDVSIILITSDIAEKFHQPISNYMAKNLYPVILEIPSQVKGSKDPVAELIKQAVGIKLEF
ncbi:MAG: V-type ATP synthase subunit F [Promethearchaeota archaeon]|jgi:vacuolar-type H+-ATPase subunit F/Vma7